MQRQRMCLLLIYFLISSIIRQNFSQRGKIRFPGHRLHDTSGSGHCGRTNTNANANGKWRVTRHRHLRLINATPAATIQQGGAAHENAAGEDHYARHRWRRRRLCYSKRRCPKQFRMFNYAHHRPASALTRPIKKEIRPGNRFTFSA